PKPSRPEAERGPESRSRPFERLDEHLADVAEAFAVSGVGFVDDTGQFAVGGVLMLGVHRGVLADFDLNHLFNQPDKVLSAHKTTFVGCKSSITSAVRNAIKPMKMGCFVSCQPSVVR